MKQFILVFIGGGVGSVLRYLLSKLLNNSNSGIPYGTLFANIIGSLLIGFILGFALKNNTVNTNQTLLLATGFCGGFTTFSTFAYENHTFLKAGDMFSFSIYAIASFTIAIVCVSLGSWLVKFL